MTEQQKQAVEALLQIKCRKGKKCNGPWCTTRNQIREAFGYPSVADSHKTEHQQYLNKIIPKISALTKQTLTLDSIRQIDSLADYFRQVCGCLYHEHFEPPVIEVSREEYNEKIGALMDSGRWVRVLREDGTSVISFGPLSDGFDSGDICPVCWPRKKDIMGA